MTKNLNEKFIATPSRTSAIMKRYNIKMKKSLGQNFLVEPQILQKLIEVAEVDDETIVIEIGPGIGALTEFLALSAKRVLAFEIDQRFVNILQETLSPYKNVEVIHQDILKVDFNHQDYHFLHEAKRLVVVANLPYYITTPIIMHLLASQLPFHSLVMMMQKEVAERMTAQVGTKAYNSLTVAIQLQMKSELAFIVPRTVFIPKPNVDSAVLKLTKLEKNPYELDDSEAFQKFVQACFKQRRKTLWNNLKAYYQEIDPGQLEDYFAKVNMEPSRRAETLNLDEFIKLYLVINEKK
ncbi:16S rRNA (adenine(1518)-N(6)/adenine(1519)-N(6))-dimethyltransferase RsmA [Facklamia miroungae]|uniref:Ribosomal RNA small subunit methyltransferase A n=1 Tax=Facklamia miroungae TaxID=120956 RepID=A0A1G7RPT9_9LACT|nr:16S rRNA (adenine(1518)-N(6)/adenine(1519)-N(6))-dimethyltransferase RsmA [Facklamia miroungae]NKZ29324.1 16S rRNA (adenine(1518)-N(6)/adenine(1519)-N(6))-dimethyltransferase RsmA [Facklamia miroungae]SDG12772.1 16S rRNA (adenine1518-N6/adenine1519-N6)-dimethyltransferase [Facklamia miroungae]